MVSELAVELERALAQLLLRRSRHALYDIVLADAPEGVDQQTYPILSGLARLGPMPAARLAEEVGLDRSGTSRYADRLASMGLVERCPHPRDGRAVLLTLTPAGERVVAGLREALGRHLDARIIAWPDGQARALVDGIGRLLAADPAAPERGEQR